MQDDKDTDLDSVAEKKIEAVRLDRSSTNASITAARMPPGPPRSARFWITVALGAFVLLVLLTAMLQIFTVGKALIPG